MAGNTDVIAADAVDLELEAMRKDDYSWHPCQVYFSPNGAGLVIKYENNGSEDMLGSEKEAMTRIRARSLPLQDDECTHIKPGEHIVVSQNSESENGFFDAEVEKVLRVRHSKRTNCRCSFIIKWLQQDLNGESLKVPSSSVMRLANKSITNHPTISAFIDAMELNNSSFSCLSPPLNTVSDFDMDLHVMLEKQIEGIKNSVHGSKKRIRDEILGLEVNTHEQVKETDISMPNVKEPEIQGPDNRSPLNPLAGRAALACLMSTGINDVSKITEIPLEAEVTRKQEKTLKKSLFSKSKSSDNIKAEGKDISTNAGQARQDKTNPKNKTRMTRAKIQKVKDIPCDNNGSSKKPSLVTKKRFTRSVLNHEAANIQKEMTKESSFDEPPTQPNKKKRNNNSGVACANQISGDQPAVYRPKRRGPSLNRSATKTLENLPEGSKISLTMSTRTKGFVGTSATQFATECGIVIRNVCPMNFHTWDTIPDDVKNQMYEKLQGRFNLLRTNRVFMEYVNAPLHVQWKRTRGTLSEHWKKNGGKTNPQLARSKMKSNCRSQEDWNHLCDYWELESTRNYNDQMEVNRGKQVITSRGGSRSITNHIFHMTNPETQMPPSPLEVYHKLHFNDQKQGWQNDDARIEYENILHHKEETVTKLISEGTTITTTMEHELEKEAIKIVCAKEKTIKSAWEVGVGPVLRKKDFWMTWEAESSQPPSSETEALRNRVASLEEELKQNKEKYEKMSMFMSSKFPDFESLVSAPASNGANGSDEQLNDSDSDGSV